MWIAGNLPQEFMVCIHRGHLCFFRADNSRKSNCKGGWTMVSLLWQLWGQTDVLNTVKVVIVRKWLESGCLWAQILSLRGQKVRRESWIPPHPVHIRRSFYLGEGKRGISPPPAHVCILSVNFSLLASVATAKSGSICLKKHSSILTRRSRNIWKSPWMACNLLGEEAIKVWVHLVV